MEKNNNVVDGVIEQVEKGEKIKEKAIKKIKQDKDVRKYASDVFSLIVGFLSFLLILEVPDIVSYFYVKEIKPFDVVVEVVYVIFLLVVIARNYITLRKINSK